MYAWTAHELFFMGILAAVPVFHKFLEYLLKDDCAGINKLLSTYFNDVLKETECFTVVASQYGCWWFLLIPSVLLLLCPVISLMAEAALRYY